jgi:HSP20 family protein
MKDDLTSISRIENQLNSLFRQLRELDRLRHTERPGIWRPNVDIVESEDGLEIIVELPGVESKDVSAEIRQGVLLIRGNKQPPNVPAGGGSFICMERHYGEFACEIILDQELDFDAAEAGLVDGELRIFIPKTTLKSDEIIRLKIDG